MYPLVTDVTPGTFSKASSMHQKHPPAKAALARLGFSTAKAMETRLPVKSNASARTLLILLRIRRFIGIILPTDGSTHVSSSYRKIFGFCLWSSLRCHNTSTSVALVWMGVYDCRNAM